MKLIEEGRIDGYFEGWQEDGVYKIEHGHKWMQTHPIYDSHYSYRPHARVWREGHQIFLEIAGMSQPVQVVLTDGHQTTGTEGLWTWSGKYFGYRDGSDLWTFRGLHIGRFKGSEVYDRNGWYLGELVKERLVTAQSKKHHSGPSFARQIQRVENAKHAAQAGYAMGAGYKDFPAPEDFTLK